MKRTFKYRAKVNKQTEINLNIWLNLCRQLYNVCLEHRILSYKYDKKSFNYYDQVRQLSDFKKTFSEFKFVDAQTLCNVVRRLDRSFQNFYRRLRTKQDKPGFPRFKSKYRYHSFTLEQNSWKLVDNKLHIRNVGILKLRLSRPIQGNIKTITIKRSSTGNWHVSFSCNEVPKRQFPKTTKQVGIDLGLTKFAHDSDNHVIKNPKYFKQSEKLLASRQQSLSRKVKYSNRRKQAKLLVAKAHEKIRNQRLDFLHKVANYYVNNYDVIIVEDLNIKQMLLSDLNLNKHIHDASWNIFFNLLDYKAEEADRTKIKVDPTNTSKMCSSCHRIVEKSLYDRIHECLCGYVVDRDYNSSLNIKALGQSAQSLNSVN